MFSRLQNSNITMLLNPIAAVGSVFLQIKTNTYMREPNYGLNW